MVMYSVAEPYLLEIFLKRLEVFGVPVAVVFCIYLLQKLTYLEVVTAVLVPDDVASHLRGLRQIVEHLFLVKRQT